MAVAPQRHQFVVVGGGLLGLSTAWALSRRGHEVVVLEAHSVGHDHSGSKGRARIFRLSYTDPLYVRMARAAGVLWRALEAEAGTTLLHQTGQLNFGQHLNELAGSLGQSGVPIEHLSAQETRERFPDLSVEGPSLFEASSGVLVADRCLQALQRTGSFEVREGCPVQGVDEDEDGVTITCGDRTRLRADAVIVCAGPATTALLGGARTPAAALPSLQQVVYLQSPSAELAVPPFIEWGNDMVYGLPVIGQALVKLSHHTSGPVMADPFDPANDDPDLLAQLRRAAERLLPTCGPEPVATERCHYDATWDGDFLLDRRGRLVVGSGTSGHGFKFGPLLGELLADLATSVDPSFDLRRFSLSRTPNRSGVNP
jgi:sarcosine oxidase